MMTRSRAGGCFGHVLNHTKGSGCTERRDDRHFVYTCDGPVRCAPTDTILLTIPTRQTRTQTGLSAEAAHFVPRSCSAPPVPEVEDDDVESLPDVFNDLDIGGDERPPSAPTIMRGTARQRRCSAPAVAPFSRAAAAARRTSSLSSSTSAAGVTGVCCTVMVTRLQCMCVCVCVCVCVCAHNVWCKL